MIRLLVQQFCQVRAGFDFASYICLGAEKSQCCAEGSREAREEGQPQGGRRWSSSGCSPCSDLRLTLATLPVGCILTPRTEIQGHGPAWKSPSCLQLCHSCSVTLEKSLFLSGSQVSPLTNEGMPLVVSKFLSFYCFFLKQPNPDSMHNLIRS